jgi:guanylate kinase
MDDVLIAHSTIPLLFAVLRLSVRQQYCEFTAKLLTLEGIAVYTSNHYNRLIVLDGVSGSGKSSLLSLAKDNEKYAVIKKRTTRPRRESDESWEFDFCDHIDVKSGTITYSALGYTYGIDVDSPVRKNLNKIFIVVCTDLQAIKDLREYYNTKHAYIYRHNTPEELESLLRQRGTDANQYNARMIEFYSEKEEYIARLGSIDAVLLNIHDTDYLFRQLEAVCQIF